mmetsp:Transcript_21427/g.45056  ORF Transcript_21427/g.45056 Transcript_21427/m.45056 type:complete len:118 (+) Transcript_21427:195-548(+)
MNRLGIPTLHEFKERRIPPHSYNKEKHSPNTTLASPKTNNTRFFRLKQSHRQNPFTGESQHPQPRASSKFAGACESLISIKFDPPAPAPPGPAAPPFAASVLPGKLVANFRNKLLTL